jgi:hypothetical protein
VETRLPGYARGIHLALASLLWATAALLALLTRPGAVRLSPKPETPSDAGTRTPAVTTRREAVPS